MGWLIWLGHESESSVTCYPTFCEWLPFIILPAAGFYFCSLSTCVLSRQWSPQDLINFLSPSAIHHISNPVNLVPGNGPSIRQDINNEIVPLLPSFSIQITLMAKCCPISCRTNTTLTWIRTDQLFLAQNKPVKRLSKCDKHTRLEPKVIVVYYYYDTVARGRLCF